jgi:phenylacetate-CoA ligase
MPSSTGRQYMLNRFVKPADVLEFIATNRIAYLVTRPIEAHALGLEAIASVSGVRLDLVLGMGTAMRFDERAACVAAFGARVLNPYGAKDGGQLAYPCPTGEHQHLNEESALVEIVDDHGQPCLPGETGRVLVTPLYNFAQPLIRYEQGDVAVLGEPCACGRTLRVLQEVLGRQEQLFQFAGGRKFSMTFNYELMEQFGVRHWQVAQVGPLAVEVRYVPSGPTTGDPEPIVRSIKAKAMRDDIVVSFRQVDDIARRPGGKHLSYVYEVPG